GLRQPGVVDAAVGDAVVGVARESDLGGLHGTRPTMRAEGAIDSVMRPHWLPGASTYVLRTLDPARTPPGRAGSGSGHLVCGVRRRESSAHIWRASQRRPPPDRSSRLVGLRIDAVGGRGNAA